MYKILPYSYKQARRLGVKIKPSTVKGKKIDVYKNQYAEYTPMSPNEYGGGGYYDRYNNYDNYQPYNTYDRYNQFDKKNPHGPNQDSRQNDPNWVDPGDMGDDK